MKKLTKADIETLRREMPVLNETETRVIIAGSGSAYDYSSYIFGDPIYSWDEYTRLFASGSWGGGFVDCGDGIVNYILSPAVVTGSGNSCGHHDPWDGCGHYNPSDDSDCGDYNGICECGDCSDNNDGGGGGGATPNTDNGDDPNDISLVDFPIPEDVQILPGECVPNCITQLLKFFGDTEITLNAIMTEMIENGLSPLNGLNGENTKSVLEKYFDLQYHYDGAALAAALSNGNPVFSLIEDPGDSNGFHSVVITRARMDENGHAIVHYYDPYYNHEVSKRFKDEDGNILFADLIEIKDKK